MLTSSAVVASRSRTAKRPSKGAEIRAKIAANRAKRLAIADAMKREAGVTEHTVPVHKEDLNGFAYFDTGLIISPEGRKIAQLCTLAHECGHVFLHNSFLPNSGVGYRLPTHVQELEAETYAHQALREHGMTVPRWRTRWGRQYVGEWVAKDRATGIAIDPRAEAYAAGIRSPYEPLRMVPSTWRIFRPEGSCQAEGSWLRRLLARLREIRLAQEARAVVGLAASWILRGYVAFAVGGAVMSLVGGVRLSDLFPDVFPVDPTYLYRPQQLTAVCCGLLLANLAVLWRTMRR